MSSFVSRPVPRWLHVWAIATVVVAALLLILGEMVTTLRAGMVDPDWPTRPWHLALESRDRWTAGYLVEHAHRILGFLVGAMVSVLALGAWAYEPRKGLRLAALGSLVALLLGFGYFHGQMMAQIDAAQVRLPIPSIIATMVPLVAVLGVCVFAAQRPTHGTGVRVLAVVALVAVMIQGLLGGLRVRLNELIGTNLAAVHGVFATLVLSVLVAIAVLTARGPRDSLPAEAQRKLGWQSGALVICALIQIAFGAMVRHTPDKLSSRLHLLFAFVVVGFATLVIKQALADSATKQRFRWPARILMALITLQIVFGVEAWMGKFMGTVPVELQAVPSIGQAIIRTAHAHIGAWILAVSVVFAIFARRNPVNVIGPDRGASVSWHDANSQFVGVGSPS
jgi:heme a synthase